MKINGLKESTYAHVAGALVVYSTIVVTREVDFEESTQEANQKMELGFLIKR